MRNVRHLPSAGVSNYRQTFRHFYSSSTRSIGMTKETPWFDLEANKVTVSNSREREREIQIEEKQAKKTHK